MKHRRDIDGLRAIAVIPVVLFHAGLPGVSGGFVGVDIFFVISGFLITRIIHEEITGNRFSILNFYERRIRRILPALLAMLTAVLLTIPVFLLPSQMRDVPVTALGALAFVSNIIFWRQSGYFDDSATTKPLLHTWSLGIEEQFYLFVPIFLILVMRFFPRSLRGILWACAIASFALCLVATALRPAAAFYLIPTRAWELLAGSLLAVNAVPAVQGAVTKHLLAITGAGLVGGAFFFITEDTAFPGYAALAPVLGAALLIHSGTKTWVARALEAGPLVHIGLISYSLYLWHWPIFVYGASIGAMSSFEGKLALIALSGVVAHLSWRYVEQPFRRPGTTSGRPLFASAITGVVCVSVLALGIQMGGQRSFLYSEEVMRFDRGRYDISPKRAECHRSRLVRLALDQSCKFGDGPSTVAVWGDSHGVELSYALAQQGMTVTSMTYSACPPITGYHDTLRSDCVTHNERALDYISNDPVPTVLLALYYSGRGADPTFMDGLTQTAAALRAAGKTVIILGPKPILGEHVPNWLARGGATSMPRKDFEDRNAATIENLAAFGPETQVVWPADFLCDDARCYLARDGYPLFFNRHHLSMHGAAIVAEGLLESGLLEPDAASADLRSPSNTGKRD